MWFGDFMLLLLLELLWFLVHFAFVVSTELSVSSLSILAQTGSQGLDRLITTSSFSNENFNNTAKHNDLIIPM